MFLRFVYIFIIYFNSLISSTIQEQYMEVVNPFILKNKERMIVFLDQLSLVFDPNPLPGMHLEQNSNHNNQDTGKCLL